MEEEMTLEEALEIIKQHGGGHEWMWRLVVDHGYKFKAIHPQIEEAFKYWDRNVNKGSKSYMAEKRKK